MNAHDIISRLSARRRECAILAAQGLTNREIGAAMKISEKTVANYLYAVFNATGCDNRTQLALLIAFGLWEASPLNVPEPQKAEPARKEKSA